MKKLIKLFTFFLVTTLIVSCSSNSGNKDKLIDNVATFVSQSDKVIGFGYLDIEAIKNKSEIAAIPELSKTITSVFTSIKAGVVLDENIFYALTGPLHNEEPEVIYGFLKVNNKDSLKQSFMKMGYTFEPVKENKELFISYTEGTAIGFNNSISILVSSGFNNNPKQLLLDAFNSIKTGKMDSEVQTLLEKETDALVIADIQNLYTTSNTSLESLPEETRKKINKVAEAGYWTLTMDFNKGNITTQLDLSNVNSYLKDIYFLNDKGNEEIANHLGPGKPVLVASVSLNIEKIQTLLNVINGESNNSSLDFLGLPPLVSGLLNGNELSDLTNGDLGIMVSEEIDSSALLGMGLPKIHYYIGLGENKEEIITMIDTLSKAKSSGLEPIGEQLYNHEKGSGVLKVNKDYLVYYLLDTVTSSFKTEELTRKRGMENFGEEPLSVYIDLSQYAKTPAMRLPPSLAEMLDYATIEGNNEKITFVIHLKNQEENILKQVVDAFKQQLKASAGNITL